MMMNEVTDGDVIEIETASGDVTALVLLVHENEAIIDLLDDSTPLAVELSSLRFRVFSDTLSAAA
jgi:hypothetical protein